MTHYLWTYCTRAVCQGLSVASREPGVLHALRETGVTTHCLPFLYEDNPADPLDVLCGLSASCLLLLVVKFIACCGTVLEEPAHLAQAHNFLSEAANWLS